MMPENKIIYENGVCSVIFDSSSITDDNKYWRITDGITGGEYKKIKHGIDAASNPDFQIYEIIKLNNEFVEKGQPLLFIQKGDPIVNKDSSSLKVNLSLPLKAPETGVFICHFNAGNSIKDGDKLFSIFPLSEDKTFNYSENPIYKYYFDRSIISDLLNENIVSEYLKKRVKYINTWLVIDGQYVSIGTSILEIRFENDGKFLFRYNLVTKSNGYIELIKLGYSRQPIFQSEFQQNEHLYTLYKDKASKYYNKPKITTDDFTKIKTIKWEVIGGLEKPFHIKFYNPIGGIQTISNKGLNLFFSFQNHGGRDYIVFYYFVKEYKLNISDKILFLFDSGEIVNFDIREKATKSTLAWNDLNEVKIPISLHELELFSNSKLLKWRIELIKTNLTIEGFEGNYWYSKNDLIDLIQSFTKEYQLLVESEVENYRPFENETEKLAVNFSNTCFLYLMIDHTNNYHKIGISNSPKYREKTLQSEKPSIEMVCFKEFPSRRIAESIEKALHFTFSDKRLRGEWFELSEFDVTEIIGTLK